MDMRQKAPWLPTTLVGRNFGASSTDTLTDEYVRVLKHEVDRNMTLCQAELKAITTTTEEALYHKARCTQAIREYTVMLQDIEERYVWVSM